MTPGVRETDASFRNEAVRDRLLRPGWTILTFGLVAVLQEVGLARLLSFKLQTFEIQAAVCVGIAGLCGGELRAERRSLAQTGLAVCWPGRRLLPPC